MQLCSCVSHWNAAHVCLTSQYSICSDTLPHYCSSSHQTGTKAKWFCARHTQNVCVCVQMDKERIRKQLYMSCRGFSSAHRRAWTNSWMKFTCKLWTKARPSVNVKGEGGIDGAWEWGDRQTNQLREKEKGKNISNDVYCQSACQWYPLRCAAELDECMPYLQFLCPPPGSPTSAASREYQGHLPSPSKWPQTLLPRETLHAH